MRQNFLPQKIKSISFVLQRLWGHNVMMHARLSAITAINLTMLTTTQASSWLPKMAASCRTFAEPTKLPTAT
jgi:hypothetical protein